MYKVDGNMLAKMGISLPFPSAQLRIYGNGGKMLPESNAAARKDDLQENAVLIEDGGDGTFNTQDYFCFYAPGPHHWSWDPTVDRFRFQKNIYADSAWYFITIGGQGKRIPLTTAITTSTISNSANAYYAYEKDETNLLQSGKEWFGEEFAYGFGRLTSRDFDIPIANIITTEPMTLYTEVLGRSIMNASRFEMRMNNALLYSVTIPALTGGAYEPIATPMNQDGKFITSSNTLKLNINFIPGNTSAQGWLNKFEWNGRVKLDMSNPKQLLFRDTKSMNNASTRFSIDNTPAGTRVLDVTDFSSPVEQVLTKTGSTIQFNAETNSLKEFVAFSPDRFLTPVLGAKMANQNLHAASIPQFLIISHADFLNEAKRIGQFHAQQQGLTYLVADVQQIYNEFSSGSPDPTAIRDFVKMFYDKAGNDSIKRPKYLLLFGDASFDPKNRMASNTNFVSAYQSSSSLDLLTTYTSDDYFGFLDDHEDINASTTINLLDIGIGRIPVSTVEEARLAADKIEAYASSFGPWRSQITLIADDEDQNLHFKDAEQLSSTIRTSNEQMHQQKIYLDAYPQETNAGGARYPLVNADIDRYMYNGNLIWNYSGHGGYKRLAEEAILEESMISNWKNEQKLPLFITATCDFAPFDNPQIRSLGEQLLLSARGGAIALMTTTRAVFAFANRIINTNYLATALAQQKDGSYLSLGDAVKRSKNLTYQTITDAINNRKFTLLGDPALVLGFPKHQVVTTKINDKSVNIFTDTLRALNKYTLSGEIRSQAGFILNDFNGTVYTTFYDKAQERTTRANDPGSERAVFVQQQNVLFKGTAAVKNGRFEVSFIVPKDIDLKNGLGRLSYYAEDGKQDAAGVDQRWYIGGLGNQISDDKQGPILNAYLNDERFVNGGIVNEKSILIVTLSDTSGLNAVGTGIGHDMIAILDDKTNNVFVLNDFFEAAKGSYQQGTIRYPLPVLEEGLHTLKIRAWDVFNNPTEITLTFRVIKQKQLEIKTLHAYPNPFRGSTTIQFEHNRNDEVLDIKINIYTTDGKGIKSLTQQQWQSGNRVEMIWDGTNTGGISVQQGTYLYTLIVKSRDGRLQTASGKLIKY